MVKTMAAALAFLLHSTPAQAQPAADAAIANDAPADAEVASSPQHRWEQRLRSALELSDEQRPPLQNLRQALVDQLAAIRRQFEGGEFDEEEARWQTKMALASHRQSRAALLSEEQVDRLQGVYNAQGTGNPQTVARLQLSGLQEEQVRMLVWQQREEWRALTISGETPTGERLRTLRQAHRLAFERLLNPAQRAQLHEAKNARRRLRGLEEEPADAPMLLDDAPDASTE